MKKLLQLEYIKYSRSWMFYIFLALFVVMTILIESITLHINKTLGLQFGFPYVWDNIIYLASWLNFFLGLMVLISITTEHQYRTVRQHIVDGLDKPAFFTAKLLYALMLALFAVVFVTITVLVIGYSQSSSVSFSGMFDGSKLLLRYFIQLLGYMSMALFFGFLFRSTALGMLLYLFYMPIDSLLGVIIFKNPNNMFPKTLFASVVPKPAILDIAQGASGLKMTGPTDQTILGMAILYIVIFTASSYFLLYRRDV
jgi:ABC-2 type transport system permease protein